MVAFTDGERIAVLETRIDTAIVSLSEISEKLALIEKDLVRYRGFWGAVTLIGSALFTVLLIFKDQILGVFRGR